jgi:membrane-associated phospholipid phosphatase
MPNPKLATIVWLAVLTAANVVLFFIVAQTSIHTIRGQMLDTVALTGNDLGRRTVDGPLNGALNLISVVSLVFVLVVVGLVALIRRRYSLAIMSVVLVTGSAATTYLLKHSLISRPDFGVDPDRAGAGNSLPSGHATAAAAFAIGLVLVLPPAVRGLASLIGANYAAVVGIATMSAGWHRPSDVIAAYLIVGGWAAFAGLLLVLAQRPSAVVTSRDRAGWSLAATLGGGLALVGAGGVALIFTFTRMSTPIEAMSERLLEIGFLGSALAVAGAAYLMMAVVLVTVHRVVPHSKKLPEAPPSTRADHDLQDMIGPF